MNSFIIVCLYCHVVELTCTPPPPRMCLLILSIPVGINISNFYLIKIIFCVMLLIRLLIYASVIVVSSVRFIPFNLNLTSRPKTLEAFISILKSKRYIFLYSLLTLLTQVLSFSFLIKRCFN